MAFCSNQRVITKAIIQQKYNNVLPIKMAKMEVVKIGRIITLITKQVGWDLSQHFIKEKIVKKL